MIDVVDFTDKLEALILVESPNTKVHFGFEHLHRRDGQGAPVANRVVVCPGNEAGDEGEYLVVKHAHRVPPDVMVFRQYVLIECWAFDTTDSTNRRLQHRAMRLLRDMVARHSQFLVLSENHLNQGEPPGIYGSRVKAQPGPTERVAGAKSLWEFWIDFSVRDIAPTSTAEPSLNLTMHMEQA